jgi:phosphoribosylaminoimidazole-succinocarboxamide synthase
MFLQQRPVFLQEPRNIDKEFLRLWFREHCDPYADETLPDAPDELVTELSRRYIFLYERITGQSFELPDVNCNIGERLQKNLDEWWLESGLERVEV